MTHLDSYWALSNHLRPKIIPLKLWNQPQRFYRSFSPSGPTNLSSLDFPSDFVGLKSSPFKSKIIPLRPEISPLRHQIWLFKLQNQASEMFLLLYLMSTRFHWQLILLLDPIISPLQGPLNPRPSHPGLKSALSALGEPSQALKPPSQTWI